MDKLDILLSQQSAQAAQLGNLIGQSGDHGARLNGLAESLRGLAEDLAVVSQHTANCPARTGFEYLRKKVTDIEDGISTREKENTTRLLAQRRTPPSGMIKLPDLGKGSSAMMIRILIYLGVGIASVIATLIGVN